MKQNRIEMNENILNDLLECSVCLERLDTTSRVLPCQHTFCRKCLEKIQSRNQQLRCPECRTLVNVKIEDLPSNILLLRILEGMKNINIIKQEQLRQVKLHKESDIQQDKISKPTPTKAAAVNFIPSYHHQQPATINNDLNKENSKQQFQLNQRKWALTPHAYALYDYKCKEIMCLQFQRGDIILLMYQIDQNWCVGNCHNHEGVFPINHVQIVVPLPLPQCIALYDFKMGPNDEEGCLTFCKGSRIEVVRRVDMNWAEGRIDADIGIFPLAFVQLNAMAKQLLYNKYLHRLHGITVPSTPSTATNNSGPINPNITYNQKSINAASTLILPSNQRVCNAGSIALPSNDTASKTRNEQFSNKEHVISIADDATNLNPNVVYRKRRSLNSNVFPVNASLTEVTQPQNQPKNRHSADVLSLPTESGGENLHMVGRTQGFYEDIPCLKYSQNKQQYSKSQENLQTLQINPKSVADIKTSSTFVQSSSSNNKSSLQNTQKHVWKLVQNSNFTKLTNPPLPWSYVACHSYMPRNSNELELKKGCIYVVTERCSNGWFKGNNCLEMKGIFPGECVTPLKWSVEQQPISNWGMINGTQKEDNRKPSVNSTFAANVDSVNNNLVSTVPQIVPPLRHAKDMTKKKDINMEKHITIGCLATSVSSSSLTGVPTHKGIGLKNLFNHFKRRTKSPNLNDDEVGGVSGNTGSSQLNENANEQNNRVTTIGIATDNVTETTSMHPSTSTATNATDTAIGHTSHLQQTPSALHIRSGSCPSQLLRNESSNEEYSNKTSAPRHLINTSSSVARHESNEQCSSLYANAVCTDTTSSTMYANQLKQQHQKIANRDRMRAKQHVQQQQSQHQLKSNMNNIKTNDSFHKPAEVIINHQKSHSLDASNNLQTNAIKFVGISRIPNSKGSSTSSINKANNNPTKGHFPCTTAFPPNLDVGQDFQVGDVIQVDCESKNGWYKSTNSRTQKTGLIPITFVELPSSNRK